MKIIELKEKVWFRAIKIIYILLLLLITIFSLSVLYDGKPEKVVKSYTYAELISMGAIPGIPTSTSDLSFASKIRPVEQPTVANIYDSSWSYWILKLFLTIIIIYIVNILVSYSFLYIFCGTKELKYYIKNEITKITSWLK